MEKAAIEIRPLANEEIGLLERHIDFDWAALHKHGERFVKQQAGEAVYLVAWHRDIPVGHALLRWNGPSDHPIVFRLDRCPDVEDLFVSPGYRSKGIGSRLLDTAESLAKQKGYSQLGIGVDIDNPSARSLYERKGFRDTGFGEYRISWPWTDKDGQERWAEENCNYLIKVL